MDNVSTSGSEQTRGSVLVWDYDTKDLIDVITDGVYAPREALALDNGDIVISNSGTHKISNKPQLLTGTPFDYSKGVVGANISILKSDGEMIVIPGTEGTIPPCDDGEVLIDDICIDEPIIILECPEGQVLKGDICIDEPNNILEIIIIIIIIIIIVVIIRRR